MNELNLFNVLLMNSVVMSENYNDFSQKILEQVGVALLTNFHYKSLNNFYKS